MLLERCNHVPEDDPPPPRLIILGRDGLGLLKLPLAGGSTITVRLHGRHVRVLLALDDALNADEDLDEAARGWLNDELLAEAYTRSDPLMIPPSPETITAYRAQINGRIRQATPPGHKPPKLLMSERCVGVRLVRRIVVVDLPQRRKS